MTQYFQNFDVTGGPDFGRRNLPLLRAELARLGLDGLLVPHEDEYQNEYLPDANERLMWVSGFTGSAGAAIILSHKAVLFTDGRYTLQSRQQVDPALFDHAPLEGGGMAAWLKAHAQNGARIGYDPKLHSPSGLAGLKTAAKARGAELVVLDTNPIDSVWADRPPLPATPVTIQPAKLAGREHDRKRVDIAASLEGSGADAAIISSPASVAWLLNIRARDVQCTPLPLSTAIIHKDASVDLFIDSERLDPDAKRHLGNSVLVHPPHSLSAALEGLKSQTVIADPQTSSAWIVDTLKNGGASVLLQADPVALPKATKNAAEIAGTQAAHRRDGAAVTRYLHWLDTEAQSGTYDEIEAAIRLEEFRHYDKGLKDLSFESISGAGPNGAVVHYRVNRATTRKLEKGSLFLIDSGGQYADGTTDITRTVPIGAPTAEMTDRYTLVLQGHIALATIRFPEGTTGSALDAFARFPLWQAGLDYDHGTGHGVGVFLGVHEGPQRISKAPNSIALQPGMIVSNEPGFYKTGEFGIRIENLQFVTEATPIPGGERKMMGFETLTLAPLNRRLINVDQLTTAERRYVDEYHVRVLAEIGPLVEETVRAWLETACAPL